MNSSQTSPVKAIFYARISTDSQRDNTSIDTQVERGKAYAISQGWSLECIFIDNGESGKSINRTAFKEMVSYIHTHPINLVLTFKLDRVFRNLKDLLIFIDDELDPRGIALQSVTENFNTQSAEGRLFLQMLGSFAEFERKRINERMKTGKIVTAQKGGWNGGHIIYGYIRKEGSLYAFDIHPEESKIVKRIFQLYAKGYGYLRIKKLTGCPLSIKGIANMLSNPFYIGKMRYGGILSDNNHPQIISQRLFNKCQKIRDNKKLSKKTI
ncbi:MAG: recombinase family protein [bacterium]